MKKDMIEIDEINCGYDFSECIDNYLCKEITKTNKLRLPCNKPNIKKICKAFLRISISKFKTINTPMGKKLVIEGIQHLKILYKADIPCGNIHSARFCMPFCTFILLKDVCKKVAHIKSEVEYACITPVDCKCFYLSTIIFLCPVFKKKPDICSCNSDNDYCSCKNSSYYYSKTGCINECSNLQYDWKEYNFNDCSDYDNKQVDCDNGYMCEINYNTKNI